LNPSSTTTRLADPTNESAVSAVSAVSAEG
jgi:hypothetical protein